LPTLASRSGSVKLAGERRIHRRVIRRVPRELGRSRQ
jgi:hypothetical protein